MAMLKRIVSLLLVLTMLVGYCLAMTAGAEETSAPVEETTAPTEPEEEHSGETTVPTVEEVPAGETTVPTVEEAPSEETAAPEEETAPGAGETIPEETAAQKTASSDARDAAAGGSFSENLTWTLIDRVLTVSGTGEMDERDEEITSVVIEEGVTSVRTASFADCSELTDVSLPESVTYIGDRAFEYCAKLSSITLPERVTYLGEAIFKGCESLTAITVPKGTDTLDSTFAGCDNLTSVTLSVTMGSAKLTLAAEDTTLFAKDTNDRAVFRFSATDTALNKVNRVEIKESKYRDMFEILDYGDGVWAIGYKDGMVDSSLVGKKASKAVSLTLNVFLEGNRTDKVNTTAKLKLSILK